MSVFDPHADAPEKLLQEGENITATFDRISATTGEVSWNIPAPADGCTSDNQAYNGAVVVLNTVANKPSNRPVNGQRYTGDPTADTDLHAGDKLDGALIVGAFYNDKETTSVQLSDLEDGAAYFITVHAVDAQNRYHQGGASAYSLPLQTIEDTPDTAAFHEVTINENTGGIDGTDFTGLQIGTFYNFSLTIDGTKHTITVDGADAQTFDALVDEINKQIKLLHNPPQSAQPPATGTYYYNQSTENLFQWDGFDLNELPVIAYPTDPNVVSIGTYWLGDPNAGDLELSRWDGAAWVVQTPQIVAGFDVKDPSCDAWWYETSTCVMYKWNGSTWCERSTIEQPIDPSDPEMLECGSYWLNGDNELFVWTEKEGCSEWEQTEAVSWEVAPNDLVPGTLWFNDVTQQLFLRIGGSPDTWAEQPVIVAAAEPELAINGTYWWSTDTSELFLKTAGEFAPAEAIIFGSDPTDVQSCSLWFDTTTDELKVWDVVNSEWDLVNQFFDTDNDPSEMNILPEGTVWVDNSDSANLKFYYWDGAQFVEITTTNVVQWANTDPSLVGAGTIWYNPITSTYFVWNGTNWDLVDPIESTVEPGTVALGAFWFDTTNNQLNQWNGTTWITISFVTSPPFPTQGALWFDNVNDILYTWNGSEWVVAVPKATAELNVEGTDLCSPEGNIVFTTSTVGSYGDIQVGRTNVSSDQVAFPSISYNFEGTLFRSLNPANAQLKRPVAGGDGLDGTPMYEQIGVGTDGTVDERRELADSLRKQLGYPTIEVELTQKQMDEAIQSAIEELRLRSSAAYRRVYFMMDLEPRKQRYILTSKKTGFNTIVNIMGMWRVTSAFQSTAYAAGVYGQTVLQHLYHMGTFDLVSYHLISDYIEQLEMLFATRVTYTWNEVNRELDVFQVLTRPERVLVDAVIERTEQELLASRWTKNWIERWALAQAQLTLAQIRGKFATLPGAGGGVSLNAADLDALAQQNIQWCLDDIDNFVVNDIENLGIGSEIIIG